VRQGMKAFEDALNDLVKEALRQAFPNDGDSEEAKEYQAELAALEQSKKDEEERKKEMSALRCRYQELLGKVKASTSEEEKTALEKEATAAKNKQKKLSKQKPTVTTVTKPPRPAWLRRAYGLMGAPTQRFTDMEGAWDTYRLVLVLKGELEKVFVPYLGIDKDEKDPDLEGKLLASMLVHLMEARTLRAHAAIPSENETLAILSNIEAVLARCRRHLAAKHERSKLEADKLAAEKVAKGARSAAAFLKDAHDLIEQAGLAVGGSSSVREMELGKEDRNALLLYCAIYDLERRLRREVGKFNYQDQTLTLGREAALWAAADRQLVQEQALAFQEIAATRHWLFHLTRREPDGRHVLETMGNVLEALRGIAARNQPPASSAEAPLDAVASDHAEPAAAEEPWGRTLPDEKDSAGRVLVDLSLSARDMRIPVPKETCLVGWQRLIEDVTNARLDGDSARVVVHGLPGMGKDVVATEVVRSDRAAGIALQAWLPASTDEMLREQLVARFRALQPQVVAGAGDEQEKQLAAIRKWLEEHNDWLFVVEDACWDTYALWEYVPATKGRLLVTSQSPLCDASAAAEAQGGKGDTEEEEGARVEGDGKGYTPMQNAKAFEVTELSPAESVELIRKIAPFDGKGWSVPAVECKNDAELQQLCVKHGVKDVNTKRPEDDKNETSARLRRKKVCLALEETLLRQRCEKTSGRVGYIAPAAGETSDTRKKRRDKLYRALQLDHELRNERLPTFLAEQLGNLPLSVALCGHMLCSLGSVDKLIDEFPSLKEVDEKGRNAVTDRHYLGLVRSVLLALKRLRSSGGEKETAAQEAAERLLCVLSRLPGTTTPVSLFVNDDDLPVIPLVAVDSSTADDQEEAACFEVALGLLVGFGLVRRPASSTHVAVIHQTVQGVVRQHRLGVQSALLNKTCDVLRCRLDSAAHGVLPSATHWCRHADGARQRALPELALQCVISRAYTAVRSAEEAAKWASEALVLLEEHHPAEEGPSSKPRRRFAMHDTGVATRMVRSRSPRWCTRDTSAFMARRACSLLEHLAICSPVILALRTVRPPRPMQSRRLSSASASSQQMTSVWRWR